ncbi:MAG: histidine phosphatase family protein [Pseudobdellovibrionaceae bacterium]
MPLVLAPFYLLRHGETEANVRQVAAGGGLDTPLTENGIHQARTLASLSHILEPKPTRIYHSSMSRARDTAALVNEALGLDMVEKDNLKEHIFGEWENVDWSIIKTMIDQKKEPPGGETYHEFALRVRDAINAIISETHEAPPLIVAHGGLFHAIGRLYGRPHSHVSNCELHYFEPDHAAKEFPWRVRILHHNPNLWK